MASFKEAYPILMRAEYGKDPGKFLHLNKGEGDLTIGGVYRKWHKDSLDWNFIDRVYEACDRDIKRSSRLLYYDKETQKSLLKIFKTEYWDKNKLDEVNSQIIATEIFIAATNIGNKPAVKLAQRLINTIPDGVVGKKTVNALNNFDEVDFDQMYDKKEQSYYEELVVYNPRLAHNLNGWNNRSELV